MEPKTTSVPVKLSQRDRKDLERLADHWQTTLAEAIRRAVRECLERLR